MRTLLLMGILVSGCASEAAQGPSIWTTADGGQLAQDGGGVDGAAEGKDAAADTTPPPAVDAAPVKADTPPPAPDAAPVDVTPIPPPDCGDVCKALGWCTVQGQACVATTDGDCLGSWGCKVEGACMVKDGKCVFGGDVACQARPDCKAKGMCTWHKGKAACVALWDGDCEQADVCKSAGKCKPVDGNCAK